MIVYVQNLHAILPVVFQLRDQPSFALDFVMDTGYTGELPLPLAVVEAMRLPYLYRESANFADGSDVLIPVHSATVVWQESIRNVRVFATGRRPLLRTQLLEGYEFTGQFSEGGLVTVDPF